MAKAMEKKALKKRASNMKVARQQPVDKKLWPFFILEVLDNHALDGSEYDDQGNRYLTRQQIVNFLEQDYGITTQIKAVGDNLTRLHDASSEFNLGFQLQYLEGERKIASESPSKSKRQLLRMGWRLEKDSEFDPSEIRMLIDTVIASPIIPEKQARMLIDKLRPLSMEDIVIPDTARIGHTAAYNPDFFLNIELLNEAIQKHEGVSFVLGTFNKDGKLRADPTDAKENIHDVVPLQLLISNGHYYLLAHYRGQKGDEIYKFRIDLMLQVEISADDSVDANQPKVNVVEFREHHSYMMSGQVKKVVLRIKKGSLHTLFDQFGPNVRFKNEQADTIDVELKSALYSVLFWALQYYRTVEVLSPPELREMLADAGHTIQDMYS